MRALVKVERMGSFGQGVGYDAAGKVYFVPFTVPGDEVEVEYATSEKKYRDARLITLLKPSPDRVDPECPYFETCGGCDWLHWNYEAQLKAKEQMALHILSRADIHPEKRLPILAANPTVGYRNRIQVRREGSQLGFYRRQSHDIVDVDRCRIAEPALNAELEKIRLGPLSETKEKIELILNSDGSVQQVRNQPHGAGGFGQVHSEQNRVLRATVAELMRRFAPESVLELYCGDGNLTFSFCSLAKEVVGIDFSQPGIERAQEKAKNAGYSHVRFLQGPIQPNTLSKISGEFKNPYDTLLLDPPRSGTGGALDFFIQPKLKRILYISCSPITFAQDVRNLQKKGFRFLEVRPIDMFPQTRHIEMIAYFERS